jgi:Second Messenger Oligonucleotide or Dinucleotide Synthetase domain
MTVQTQFSSFLTVIALDTERRQRIQSATDRLHTYCIRDSQISAYRPTLYFQGSYANDLAVRPADPRGEYDVDIVVLMSFPAATPATLVLNWMKDRLALDPDYNSRTLPPKDKCVRLNYAGDFHVDVVPAHRATSDFGKIQVPSRRSGWLYSHPRGYTEWCTQQRTRTGGDFNRAVKAMKRWRDNNLDARRAIKSIIFTTLLGPHVPAPAPGRMNPDAYVIAYTLQSLNRFLQGQVAKPVVANPSLPEEDLAANWSQAEYSLFRGQFDRATTKAVSAYNAANDRLATQLWRDLFGDAFPLA